MATRILTTLLAFTTIASTATIKDLLPPATFGSVNSDNNIKRRAVGGVTLSTGKNFSGSKVYVDLPVEKCINLNDYAGDTLSFQPDPGTECYLMQGKCNEELPYADIYDNSTDVGDLSTYSWIKKCQSYICFQALYYSNV